MSRSSVSYLLKIMKAVEMKSCDWGEVGLVLLSLLSIFICGVMFSAKLNVAVRPKSFAAWFYRLSKEDSFLSKSSNSSFSETVPISITLIFYLWCSPVEGGTRISSSLWLKLYPLSFKSVILSCFGFCSNYTSLYWVWLLIFRAASNSANTSAFCTFYIYYCCTLKVSKWFLISYSTIMLLWIYSNYYSSYKSMLLFYTILLIP